MPVTTRDIRDKVFRNSGRGYNKDDVDSFLDEIIDEMNLLCSKIDSLEMHIEAEQVKMKSVNAASRSAEQIMADAKAYSQQIIREAKDLAGTIIKDAQAKSEEILRSVRPVRADARPNEAWKGYPGFEEDLQVIAGQMQYPAQEAANATAYAEARRPDGFSFDDLDFEKDLSSSKENIREALLTDLGLDSKSVEEPVENEAAPPQVADNAAKKNDLPEEPYKRTSIDQDDYYNLLYGPGPASKLDIHEVEKTGAASSERETPAKEMSRLHAEQESIRRILQPSQQAPKREPIPFPGAGSEMQEEKQQQSQHRSFSLATPARTAGMNEQSENTLHRRRSPEIYEEPEEAPAAKPTRANIHFALMPLEIEERKPLQRYSTNLDGFAHLKDDSEFGYASEKFKGKR